MLRNVACCIVSEIASAVLMPSYFIEDLKKPGSPDFLLFTGLK